jgi:hypothetical protein
LAAETVPSSRERILGAMEELRARRPWIPETGQDDIPVRDEIELVRDL